MRAVALGPSVELPMGHETCEGRAELGVGDDDDNDDDDNDDDGDDDDDDDHDDDGDGDDDDGDALAIVRELSPCQRRQSAPELRVHGGADC